MTPQDSMSRLDFPSLPIPALVRAAISGHGNLPGGPAWRDVQGADLVNAGAWAAVAQVHAVLALAAATAIGTSGADNPPGSTPPEPVGCQKCA
jgi:hypothetical protein